MAQADEDRDIEVGEVQSVSKIEQMVRNKWIMAGGGAVGVIMLVSIAMAPDTGKKTQNPNQPPPEQRATQLIPGDIRQSDWISTAQAEIRAAREQMGELTEQNKDLLAKIAEKDRANEAMVREMQRLAREFEQFNQTRERESRRAPSPTPAPVGDGVTRPSDVPQGLPQPTPAPGQVPLPDGVVPPPRPADLLEDANNAGDGRTIPLPRRVDEQTIPGRIVGAGNAGQIVIRGSGASSAGGANSKGFRVNETVTRNSFAGYLPGGSFADVALMSGAEVGTAEFTRANPQPFLLRVQSEAITAGDGRYKMSSCFAVGSGYGDLSSERAFVRVNRLICMDPTQKLVLEQNIDGYIVDSDGTQGLKGEVIRRNGQLIAKALLAGFAEGITSVAQAASQASAQSLTNPVGGLNGVQDIDIDAGRLGEAGAFGGAANAASQLAELYIQEARNIFPIIRVDSGRKATLVLLQGVSLEWKAYEGLYTVKQEPVEESNSRDKKGK